MKEVYTIFIFLNNFQLPLVEVILNSIKLHKDYQCFFTNTNDLQNEQSLINDLVDAFLQICLELGPIVLDFFVKIHFLSLSFSYPIFVKTVNIL